MDDDTRQAFASMMAAVSTVDANVRASSALQTENAREFRAGIAAINGRVDEVVGDVKNIKRHVFGSDPPPSPPAHGGAIVRQVSENDAELDAHSGRLLAVEVKVDTLTKMQEEQLEMLRTIVKAVTGVLNNPMVRRVAYVVGLGIVGWATTKGWLHQ